MSIAAFSFPAARRREIAVPGGVMAALEFGPADRPLDVLFLHATGFNAGTYAGVLGPLGDRLRVLAVDQRGHGRTTLAAEPWSFDAWTRYRDDVLALLAALGETPAVISGHSMGGTVGLLAVAARPDAARRLVLFEPVVMTPERLALVGDEGLKTSPLALGAARRRATFPDREAAFAAYRGRGAFRTWPESTLRDYLVDGLLAGDDGQVELACRPAWEASTFAAHHHDSIGAFAGLTTPCRILRAEIGSTCQLEGHAAEVVRGGTTLETVAGTSHFLPMERPDLVRRALAEAAA
ncbi:MAG: alpha/beta fold hydrolase [Pseudomonadota bacterium]